MMVYVRSTIRILPGFIPHITRILSILILLNLIRMFRSVLSLLWRRPSVRTGEGISLLPTIRTLQELYLPSITRDILQITIT